MTKKVIDLDPYSEPGDPDDESEMWRAYKRYQKAKREQNLLDHKEKFRSAGLNWEIHTDYHWSSLLLGDRIDFWPSRNKWRWRNKTYIGDVYGFIRNRLTESEGNYGEVTT